MPAIASVRTDLYRIAQPVVLSDSTHWDISHFELVTLRIVDAEGAEGVGYTCTVGVDGVAIHATVERHLAPLLAGREAADIAAAWQAMWWATHYGGHGGAAVLAEAFNLPVTSHGAHDVTVHLLAAAPNRSYLEAHGFRLERYVAHPLAIVDRFAVAPSRPGHGIEFDWAGLERTRPA
jgi:L-alanine-DL-glutamate epimerase-like enolase superfamily enzyme